MRHATWRTQHRNTRYPINTTRCNPDTRTTQPAPVRGWITSKDGVSTGPPLLFPTQVGQYEPCEEPNLAGASGHQIHRGRLPNLLKEVGQVPRSFDGGVSESQRAQQAKVRSDIATPEDGMKTDQVEHHRQQHPQHRHYFSAAHRFKPALAP